MASCARAVRCTTDLRLTTERWAGWERSSWLTWLPSSTPRPERRRRCSRGCLQIALAGDRTLAHARLVSSPSTSSRCWATRPTSRPHPATTWPMPAPDRAKSIRSPPASLLLLFPPDLLQRFSRQPPRPRGCFRAWISRAGLSLDALARRSPDRHAATRRRASGLPDFPPPSPHRPARVLSSSGLGFDGSPTVLDFAPFSPVVWRLISLPRRP